MRSDLPLTVFFDASCPMCRSEILNIKAHDARGHLRLVDCSATGFDAGSFHKEGVTVVDMMTRLHVRDRQGAWIRGAAAMELIYRTAGMQRMARLWESHTLLARIYPWIARHRQALSRTGIPVVFALWMRYAAWRAYRRMDGCKTGSCSAGPGETAPFTSKTKNFPGKWLLLVAYGHILAGVAIPFVAYSAGFYYYASLLQQTFWPHAAVPAQTLAFQRWIVALFGPTIASVGVVMAYLVRAGIRTGETWPWNAILLALAAWAPGDIGISMMQHFWLHLWLDIAALLIIVPPALILRARAASPRHLALTNPC